MLTAVYFTLIKLGARGFDVRHMPLRQITLKPTQVKKNYSANHHYTRTFFFLVICFPSTFVENGEPLQVLHYAVGQKFEPHFDYTDGTSVTKIGGPRKATFLMYL